MIEALEPVPLQELRALGTAKVWDVEGELDELPSLTPVRGHVCAEHRGNVLAVEGKLSTIVTLCCDRCLNQFNQSLSCTPSELIWLGDEQPTADELELCGEVAEMEGLVVLSIHAVNLTPSNGPSNSSTCCCPSSTTAVTTAQAHQVSSSSP